MAALTGVRRVALTGSDGFLGREVTQQLQVAGHEVVPLRRGPTDLASWSARCATVDVVIHLGAPTLRVDDDSSDEALIATRRLFDAFPDRPLSVVFAGSMAIFRSTKSVVSVSETSETWQGAALDLQDRYTRMKKQQEDLMRSLCVKRRCPLTIIRPTNVWSQQRWQQSCVGPMAGPFWLIVDPPRRLRLTHVQNCARAFVTASTTSNTALSPREINVDDNADVSAWHYATRLVSRGERRYVPLPLPAWLFDGAALLAGAGMRLLMPKRRVPGLLIEDRRSARFARFRVDTAQARGSIAWNPDLDVYRGVR